MRRSRKRPPLLSKRNLPKRLTRRRRTYRPSGNMRCRRRRRHPSLRARPCMKSPGRRPPSR
ncbi:MAG: hypothetical protein C4521_00485 [Actinobacteria bacterium]|nr:MAG: hypothetical protein C4521_00485 [Actinomycetota bacterium]